MSQFQLRTMTDTDRAGVARVGHASWMDNRHYPEWLDPAVEARVKNWLDAFVMDPKSDLVVCINDAGVVGWGARDNHEQPGKAGAPLDYITDLWIDPKWQGLGIGTSILNELTARMRAEKLTTARIEVAQANLRAIDLYIRQGFRETWRGIRMSATLGLPLPRILLEKQL